MIEPNFSHNLFLTTLRQLLKNYVIKTIFFLQHNKLFDWSEIEDSI